MIILKAPADCPNPEYTSEEGYTMQHNGSKWVLYNAEHAEVDRDQYRDDLAERAGCKIEYT